MKDERAMILNMLKEGKISVEEADALLEVLGEDEDQSAPGGFSASERPDDSRSSAGEPPRQERISVQRENQETRREDDRSSGSGRGRRRKGFDFDFDLDLGGLRDTLREAMKGVTETVKGVTEGLADLDIGEEIFRSMGKIRAEDVQETSRELEGAERLSISNKWGDVRVTGSEEERITIRAEAKAWGATDEDARATLDRLSVGLEREGMTWQVRSGLEDGGTATVRVDYVITVPRRLNVAVSTASGDIWLESLDGEQEVKTLSGDLSVADIGADRSARQVFTTKSGDLVGGALTGEVSLSTLSGDIEISGFTGGLQVSTKSGDISIRDGHGWLQARTLSGDLAVSLAELGDKPVELTSVSGDIHLEVPPESALDLSAKSKTGDVRSSLDFDAEKRSEHTLVGRANGGGLAVSATSVSGDIMIAGA